MRSVFIIILLLIHSIVGISQGLEYYRCAIDQIKKSPDFGKYTETGTKKIQVLTEEIPFSVMAPFFYEDIKKETGIDYNLRFLDKETKENEYFKALSDKKRSKLKLFFSSIEDNLFTVELVYSRSARDLHYKNILVFGQSLVYLFKIENDTTFIVKSILMQNN